MVVSFFSSSPIWGLLITPGLSPPSTLFDRATNMSIPAAGHWHPNSLATTRVQAETTRTRERTNARNVVREQHEIWSKTRVDTNMQRKARTKTTLAMSTNFLDPYSESTNGEYVFWVVQEEREC